jgi:hypothetical protein
MRHAVETGGGKPVRCERCGGLVKVSYKSGSSQEVYQEKKADIGYSSRISCSLAKVRI